MTTVVTEAARQRQVIRVTGVVQGVGFRPFVLRLAREVGLTGFVGNDTDGVFIEVEGPQPSLDSFHRRLEVDAPPLARIFRIDSRVLPLCHDEGFRIVPSRVDGPVRTFVSPDVAVCDDCLAELHDPLDRRSRYPFINCTNCGPRFTITRHVPYDRPNTTMAGFTLCPSCRAEYHDSDDRRFHAQPVACEACGPRLWFESTDGVVDGTDPALTRAQQALAHHLVLAVKGLGGFHLACDARADAAVGLLRRRKHRQEKPFAVMVRDLSVAARLTELDDVEAALLQSPQRPIVLLRRRPGAPLSDLVAPGNPRLGVLLPYTPLHHLLFAPIPGSHAPVPDMLVMTSGNLSDEPICFDDDDAHERLGHIADAWLTHDRPIHVPCDDSVVCVADGHELPLRRSRGYAPLPVTLPFAAPDTLAVGGELKNTFCLTSGREAFISQHLGDMGNLETLGAFERSVAQFEDIYEVTPSVMAADVHPSYHTRQWAEARAPDDLVFVQHHHAHIASLMAEHGIAPEQSVIGFAFDGTGFGTDESIWGGEILRATYRKFDRVGHLRAVALPGGDTSVRRPYRVALAHLWAAGIDWSEHLPPVSAAPPDERAQMAHQLRSGVGCVPCSSMGRLFDAVSSLLGLRHVASYEAQAAMELEWIADAAVGPGPPYAFGRRADGIDPAPVLVAMLADLERGVTRADMAAGFHAAVADLILQEAGRLRRVSGIGTVALSGGVFQNLRLLRLARDALVAGGFEVLTHRLVPPNDGGLALGQAVVAAARTMSTS